MITSKSRLTSHFAVRSLATSASSSQQAPSAHTVEISTVQRNDVRWEDAKEFETLPGPSKLGFLVSVLPLGNLYKANIVEIHKAMRQKYGDIYRLKGMLGRNDMVFTYNPHDIELTYRTEGIWPLRPSLESYTYYRQVKRPNIFHGVGGVIYDQGKDWGVIRNKVNPILMKVQNVRQHLPQIDEIASDFLKKLEKNRDPKTNTLNINFQEELKMWAFESISFIALNTRMGLMTDKPDPNAHRLAQNLTDFFNYSYLYDAVLPPIYKSIETPGFKRYMRVCDEMAEITTNYIDRAIEKFTDESNVEARSVLEKLYRTDKQIAFVMAMDMLMGGIDTTASIFVSLLYLLARNPEKQSALRLELQAIMPEKNTPLTAENTNNMPYLRACIKEALRMRPITPVSYRLAGKDLVLSGYRVPQGTGVLMGVMELANSETYFARSCEFLPERWLKSGSSACPAAKATNPFAYLPFGFGPRTCIGKRIAEMEMETLLAKIIRNYHVSWQSEQDLHYISNMILVPTGDINFRFEPVV